MRALQVYLDSSDFSNLSLADQGRPKLLEVRDFLVEMQASGRIQLRYSAMHVLEAAPVGTDALQPACRRFNTIRALCGAHALAHPVDLLEREISSAEGDGDVRLCDALRDDGFWLPSLLDPKRVFLKSADYLALENIAPNRENRRRLRNGAGNLAAILKREFPLRRSVAKLIDQYYAGTIDYDRALEGVRQSLTNLDDIAACCLERGESAVAFSKDLRELGEELRKVIDDGQQELEAALRTHNADRPSDKELSYAITKAFKESVGKPGRLAATIASELVGTQLEPADPWKSLPGLACSAMLTMYAARRSIQVKQPRPPLSSDLPDALHAYYLPYVDVFRADAFMAGQIKECNFPFATKVVERFESLPDVIQTLLEQQEQAAES